MHCNNCGKRGHIFKSCRNPITSCGIILINSNKLPIYQELKILMVRRKDSMAYTEFLRGKYDPDDDEYIKKLLSNMTTDEQTNLISTSFEKLWKIHWGDEDDSYSKEFGNSLVKFNKLNIKDLVFGVGGYSESEWGFPKGRRTHKENDIECASREFWEETNIPRDYYTICSNLILTETFLGTNNISYTHRYFVGLLEKDIDITKDMSESQKKEISAIEWKSINECRSVTRPHYIERNKLLENLENIVNTFNTQYNLFS